MLNRLDEQARLRITWHEHRTLVAASQHGVARIQTQAALLLGGAVALAAIRQQHRADALFDEVQLLRGRDVDSVDIVGIATDHCVRATALDAAQAGFHARVLTDLTAGVAPDTTEAALEEMKNAGVELATAG